MIRTAGNRVFAGLSRILNLSGTENLSSIDISVAQPTYDLQNLVASEQTVVVLMGRRGTMPTAGATQVIPFNPYTSDIGDADGRFLIQAQGNTPNVFDGAELRREYDAWLIDFGLTTNTGLLTSTNVVLARRHTLGVVPSGYPPRTVRPIWRGNTTEQTFSGSLYVPGDAQTNSSFLPVRCPSETYVNGDVDELVVQFIGAGAGADVTYWAAGRLLVAPKGVLPQLAI